MQSQRRLNPRQPKIREPIHRIERSINLKGGGSHFLRPFFVLLGANEMRQSHLQYLYVLCNVGQLWSLL